MPRLTGLGIIHLRRPIRLIRLLLRPRPRPRLRPRLRRWLILRRSMLHPCPRLRPRLRQPLPLLLPLDLPLLPLLLLLARR